jgi:hypothetical protein
MYSVYMYMGIMYKGQGRGSGVVVYERVLEGGTKEYNAGNFGRLFKCSRRLSIFEYHSYMKVTR